LTCVVTRKLRENLAPSWAVRQLNQVLAMVQCSVEDQTASAKKDLVAGGPSPLIDCLP
jgi:hypothetical protein